MNFLLDQNMPVSLCNWLVQRGHSAEHIRFIGLENAPDTAICAEAQRRQAILVTKDRDDIALVDREQILQLLLIRTGNKSIGELLRILERRCPDAESRLARGEGLIEIA